MAGPALAEVAGPALAEVAGPALAVVPAWLPLPGEPLPGEPLPGEPLPVGLTPVLPVEGSLVGGGGGVVDDDDVGGVTGLLLLGAGADVLAAGLAVLTGLGLPVGQGPAVALAWLPAALTSDLAVAEAVEVVLPVALPPALAVAVAGAVAVVAVPSPGLTLAVLPLLGVPLSLPLAGVVSEPAGLTGGFCVRPDPVAAAEEEGGAQAVAVVPLGPAGVAPPGPAALFCEAAALPDPSRLGALPLGLDEEIPTADPSWMTASRSGGSARATPMANTAQAAARAGLSSPSRQSRGRCRPPACSCPSRPPFQRAARPARKPPGPAERLLARAGPDRTRARIRSSPSGWGSTWSAAACSARRRYSPKSIGSGPCGGMPSNPDLVITRAPGPRAGRSCRGRCGS